LQEGKSHDVQGLDLSFNSLKIAIVVSRFNEHISAALLKGALRVLKQSGIQESHIQVSNVPGSFELPVAAQIIIRAQKPDAVICLGALIRGETDHYRYLAAEVSRGIGEVALSNELPVIFGVLTTDSLEQAQERAGGLYGNKGEEAAMAALHMVSLQKNVSG
jgi:6,7-dimethyl-8-ribityllumazine synthase